MSPDATGSEAVRIDTNPKKKQKRCMVLNGRGAMNMEYHAKKINFERL